MNEASVKQVRVLYFAVAEDLRGLNEEQLALPDSVRTVSDFMQFVEAQYPTFQGLLKHMRIARNERFAEPFELLAPGDTLALIPPVAGG
jgi:molybdopterin converting factor subunit 1